MRIRLAPQEAPAVSADNTVAFSAWRGSRNVVGTGAVVVYENVDVNVGGAYDAATGIFTCPVNGYYMFHVYAMTESGVRASTSNCILPFIPTTSS